MEVNPLSAKLYPELLPEIVKPELHILSVIYTMLRVSLKSC